LGPQKKRRDAGTARREAARWGWHPGTSALSMISLRRALRQVRLEKPVVRRAPGARSGREHAVGDLRADQCCAAARRRPPPMRSYRDKAPPHREAPVRPLSAESPTVPIVRRRMVNFRLRSPARWAQIPADNGFPLPRRPEVVSSGILCHALMSGNRRRTYINALQISFITLAPTPDSRPLRRRVMDPDMRA
jgi:hypothetical protein